MKGVLWKVAKRLSYIQDARYLKVKDNEVLLRFHFLLMLRLTKLPLHGTYLRCYNFNQRYGHKLYILQYSHSIFQKLML